MPLPFAAAIVYGMILGGGAAAAVAAAQRLWRYFNLSPQEQDKEDERLSDLLATMADALARARYGASLSALTPNQRTEIDGEVQREGARFADELNRQCSTMFGRNWSALNDAARAQVLRKMADGYRRKDHKKASAEDSPRAPHRNKKARGANGAHRAASGPVGGD